MTQIKERPILFSADMVRAILDGRKTQTRRHGKPVRHPDLGNIYDVGALVLEHEPQHVIERACPYGRPGERLWVRESFALSAIDPDGLPPEDDPGNYDVIYRADPPPVGWIDGDGKKAAIPWKPCIHMPRWASRILLEVVSVRVEKLGAISEADCIAEGCAGGHGSIPGYAYAATPIEHYRALWDFINGAGDYDKNPWVWVVEFRVLKTGEANV